MDLDNISLMIPDPINTHLKDLYGENYKIADKNWHNNKEKIVTRLLMQGKI